MPPKIQRSNPAFFGAKSPAVVGAETPDARAASPVGALVGVPEDAVRIVHLAVDLIVDNPHQPRTHFDPAELEALRDSIATYGLQQPIGVRQQDDGRYQLVFGERRLRCVRSLGQRTVPCVLVRADLDDAEITVIENMLRADLNPFEQADALATLKERRGHSNADLGRIFGMDRGDVSRTLGLRKLPLEIRDQYEHMADKPARYRLWRIAALDTTEEQMAAWRALVGAEGPSSTADDAGDAKDDEPRDDHGPARRDEAAVTLSAFSLRVARNLQRAREALHAFQSKPKRLEAGDREVLIEMKAAIEAILTDEQGQS